MRWMNLSGARIASMVNPVLVGTALIVTAFGIMTIGSVLTGRNELIKRQQ